MIIVFQTPALHYIFFSGCSPTEFTTPPCSPFSPASSSSSAATSGTLSPSSSYHDVQHDHRLHDHNHQCLFKNIMINMFWNHRRHQHGCDRHHHEQLQAWLLDRLHLSTSDCWLHLWRRPHHRQRSDQGEQRHHQLVHLYF